MKKTEVLVSPKFNMAQESKVALGMPHIIFSEFQSLKPGGLPFSGMLLM